MAEQLSGKRIAITGSTGFVGTALVERILRAVPDCTLVLLIRPSKRHDASERARREIFKNNAFDRLRTEVQQAGRETFDEMIERRVTAIGGDVSTDGLGLSDADRAVFGSWRRRKPCLLNVYGRGWMRGWPFLEKIVCRRRSPKSLRSRRPRSVGILLDSCSGGKSARLSANLI